MKNPSSLTQCTHLCACKQGEVSSLSDVEGTADKGTHGAWPPSLVLLAWQCFHAHHRAAMSTVVMGYLHAVAKSISANKTCILRKCQILTKP